MDMELAARQKKFELNPQGKAALGRIIESIPFAIRQAADTISKNTSPEAEKVWLENPGVKMAKKLLAVAAMNLKVRELKEFYEGVAKANPNRDATFVVEQTRDGAGIEIPYPGEVMKVTFDSEFLGSLPVALNIKTEIKIGGKYLLLSSAEVPLQPSGGSSPEGKPIEAQPAEEVSLKVKPIEIAKKMLGDIAEKIFNHEP